MTMRSSDDSLRRLREAIRELAAGDAGDVVAEARAHARERVRSMLSDAMSQSLLERIEEQLALPHPESTTSSAPTPMTITEDGAWYVYGVIGPTELERDGAPTGVGGSHPVTTLREGRLAAVASQVPFDEFDDKQLRAHLADMEWVEQLARSHESVLDWTRRHATVIPMRMCTVYRTEGGVREMLRRECEAFEEALAHLDGKAEWGVKMFADPPEAGLSSGSEQPDVSGAAYMERRRQDLERKEQTAARVQEAAVQVHERLCRLATDGLVAPAQRPEASGHLGEMVLNGVYLVEDDAQADFDHEVSELQEEFESLGLALVLTGPWPPYNFVPGTIGAAW